MQAFPWCIRRTGRRSSFLRTRISRRTGRALVTADFCASHAPTKLRCARDARRQSEGVHLKPTERAWRRHRAWLTPTSSRSSHTPPAAAAPAKLQPQGLPTGGGVRATALCEPLTPAVTRWGATDTPSIAHADPLTTDSPARALRRSASFRAAQGNGCHPPSSAALQQLLHAGRGLQCHVLYLVCR